MSPPGGTSNGSGGPRTSEAALKIAVLGAGAWGTALAMAAAQRHDTVLWARDGQQAAAMSRTRRNVRYLPDVDLPAALRISAQEAYDRATSPNNFQMYLNAENKPKAPEPDINLDGYGGGGIGGGNL